MSSETLRSLLLKDDKMIDQMVRVVVGSNKGADGNDHSSLVSSLCMDQPSTLLSIAGATPENNSHDDDGMFRNQEEEQEKQKEQERLLSFESIGLFGREKEETLLKSLYQQVLTQQYSSQQQQEQATAVSTTTTTTTTKSKGDGHVVPVVVAIKGPAGVGKSFLWEKTLRNPPKQQQQQYQHWIVAGKFDQLHQNDPFSAITAAFTDLLDLFLQHLDSSSLQHIQTSIRNQFNPSEIILLSKLIYNLPRFLNQQQQQDDNHHHYNNNNDNRATDTTTSSGTCLPFSRIVQLSCSFLRLVAQPFANQQQNSNNKNHVIVLVLDDLQWASEDSLRIVQGFISDSQLNGVLLLLSFRDEFQPTFDIPHVISLQPLSVKTLQQMLRHWLLPVGQNNDNDDKALDKQGKPNHASSSSLQQQQQQEQQSNLLNELSQVVWNKTHGNPFSVTQFLALLVKQNLLQWSSKNDNDSDSDYYENPRVGNWTWDVDRILTETNVADNVMDLVIYRIQQFQQQQNNNSKDYTLLSVLQIAACLGHTFPARVLERVAHEEWKRNNEQQQENEKTGETRLSIQKTLSMAVQEGLLEKLTSSEPTYKFAHDKIQQAVYEQSEQQILQLRIANTLLMETNGNNQSSYNSDESNNNKKKKMKHLLFLIADLFHGGQDAIQTSSDRVNAAQIHLEAGQEAQSRGGFATAARYFQNGIHLLTKTTSNNSDEHDPWQLHYDLCLDLYSSAAETLYVTGNLVASQKIVDIVVLNGRSRWDKVRAQIVQIEMLQARVRLDEALGVTLKVLRGLGVRISRKVSIVHVLWSLAQMRKRMRGKTDKEIFAMPTCQDPEKIAIMRLMNVASSVTLLMGSESKLYCIISSRLLVLSCTHGLCQYSVLAFAAYGAVEVSMGHHDKGYEIGVLVSNLVDRFDAREVEVPSLIVANHLLFHWRRALSKSLSAFKENYTLGIQHGQMQMSFLGAVGYISLSALLGVPFGELERQTEQIVDKVLEYQQYESLRLVAPLRQHILNLLGRSEGPPWVLEGEAMDLLLCIKGDNENDAGRKIQCSVEMSLALYFDRHDRAVELIRDLEGDLKLVPSHYYTPMVEYMVGVASFDLARISTHGRQKRIYLSKARKRCRLIESLTQEGSINCIALNAMLMAESVRAADNNKGNDKNEKITAIKEAYDMAITECRGASFLQFEANTAERAATAMLAFGKTDLASHYLNHACSVCRQLGTSKWVEYIHDKYPDLLSCDT